MVILYLITYLQGVLMAFSNVGARHLLSLVLVLALGVAQLAHGTPVRLSPCPAGSYRVC